MAYVVAATWRAKEGQAETVLEVIRSMTGPSRAEPGCLSYIGHRSPDDPHLFFLYEQYVDAAGFEAHRATPHFQKWVVGQAVPNLEQRDLAIYETLDGAPG